MTPINPCTLCRPLRPCPWHRSDAIAFTNNVWHDLDTTATGHDLPEDTNGLLISVARHAAYARERRVQVEEQVEEQVAA